jgi:hypothetical protein
MLAGSTGLEPAASGVTGRRSNQLNYDPETLVRACQPQPGQAVWPASRSAPQAREGWWAVQDSNL